MATGQENRGTLAPLLSERDRSVRAGLAPVEHDTPGTVTERSPR
jgi:hypothetical protein